MYVDPHGEKSYRGRCRAHRSGGTIHRDGGGEGSTSGREAASSWGKETSSSGMPRAKMATEAGTQTYILHNTMHVPGYIHVRACCSHGHCYNASAIGTGTIRYVVNTKSHVVVVLVDLWLSLVAVVCPCGRRSGNNGRGRRVVWVAAQRFQKQQQSRQQQ